MINAIISAKGRGCSRYCEQCSNGRCGVLFANRAEMSCASVSRSGVINEQRETPPQAAVDATVSSGEALLPPNHAKGLPFSTRRSQRCCTPIAEHSESSRDSEVPGEGEDLIVGALSSPQQTVPVLYLTIQRQAPHCGWTVVRETLRTLRVPSRELGTLRVYLGLGKATSYCDCTSSP